MGVSFLRVIKTAGNDLLFVSKYQTYLPTKEQLDNVTIEEID